MSRRRKKHREEREAFLRRATHYQMREILIAFGDSFFIRDESGRKVFRVDEVMRWRDTLKFKDMQGNVLCQIQERMMRIKDVMAIQDADGNTVAEIKKALITGLRDRWTVKIRGGPDLKIEGNVLGYEYEIKDGRRKVALVSKQWFRVRDIYGVAIASKQEDVLILAVTVALAVMLHHSADTD